MVQRYLIAGVRIEVDKATHTVSGVPTTEALLLVHTVAASYALGIVVMGNYALRNYYIIVCSLYSRCHVMVPMRVPTGTYPW
jgi:hypothetical protein